MAQIFLHFGDREMSPISVSNKEIFNFIRSFPRIVCKHCQIYSPALHFFREIAGQLYTISGVLLVILPVPPVLTTKPIYSLATTFTLLPISLATSFTLRPIFSLATTFTLLHVTADLLCHDVHVTAVLLSWPWSSHYGWSSHTFWQKIRESK